MVEKPLVSIIIPTYNRLGTLKKAIGSVLRQTYQDIELIIVDDGSNDGTSDFFASQSIDTRIRYFYKRNEGLPSLSRNYGAREARGKYLAFLDSDDMWLPDKLQKQVEKIEKDPSLTLCYTQGTGCNKDMEVRVSGYFPIKSGRIFYPLLFRNFIITSSVLLKKVDFEKVGGFSEDKSLIIAEDLKLWLSIAKIGKGYFFDEPLVKYSMDEVSISSDITLRFACLYKVLNDEMKNAKVLGPFSYLVNQILGIRWWLKVRNSKPLLKKALEVVESQNLRIGSYVIMFFRLSLWTYRT